MVVLRLTAEVEEGATDPGVEAGSPAEPPVRGPVRFSPDGRHAVCVRTEGRQQTVERWSLGEAVRHWPVTPAAVPWPVEVGVDDDGALVVVRTRGSASHVLHLDPDGREVAQVPGTGDLPDLRLAQGVSTLAVSGSHGGTTLWRIHPRNGTQPIAAVEGVLMGGLPLEPSGRYVAFNRFPATGAPAPVLIDTQDGSVRPLMPDGGDLQLMLTDPGSGRLLFAVDLSTDPRLAVAEFDRLTLRVRHRPQIPPSLNSIHGSLRPVAFDTAGEALYLAAQRGVRSHLIRHRFRDDRQEEIELPLGVITGSGACHRQALRFPFTTPSRPPAIVTIRPSRCAGVTRYSRTAGGESSARVAAFPTSAGSVEALVLGNPWRTASQVLIALHGGPEAHWQARYDPLLSQLAAANITVVALNQRGSTGYGPQHQQAIRNAWGGPDLADVHQVADHLIAGRAGGQLAIYGASYGAYLALLAAATRPELWSHCIAVAPFLHGERLYRDAAPPVRRLLDRLGGRAAVDDELGSRDLLVATRSLRCRALLIHGTADGTIPVSHSRALYERLTAWGNCASVDYVEVAGAGHSPQRDPAGRPLSSRMIAFLKS